MPDYQFNARDENGAAQTGIVQAGSAAAVVDQLRARGWLIVQVQERMVGSENSGNALYQLPFMGPRSVHVELSLQQIAVMLRGGLTLLTALNNVAEQSTRASMRAVWRTVVEDIQEGLSFSAAM